MKLEEIFKRLGLPKHADSIFGLLRRKGPLSASEICRETKLHRPTVYRALSSLSARHFVFETKLGKRRSYRDKKKLERMVISNPVSGMRKRPRLERFVKFIPPQMNLFDQDIIQLVYGERISIIDLNKERVLIIENKALAEFQKVIFRQLYDKLPLP